ncbi:MAG: RNA polymerase sigma factor [Planctomycetes bacterium]|nr:RNA polymerase sigma factor [Planctomycetota bacterium]
MVSEDRDLVERVLAGDADAFTRLVRKYTRLGGALAFGVIGDYQLAEDILQDAFLKVYLNLESLRDPDRFRPWFCGIVRKQAIDVMRQLRGRVARAARLDDVEGFVADESDSPAQGLLRKEQRRKILREVRRLPPHDRLVLVLKHMEGLSYKEIAEVTHSSVSAVESRLFRARRALREKLSDSIRLDF